MEPLFTIALILIAFTKENIISLFLCLEIFPDVRVVKVLVLISINQLAFYFKSNIMFTLILVYTYGSNTSLEMYSFGILGSWYENTFCNPTSHRRVCLEGCLLNELPTTWNSITPLFSSQRAASSLALWVPGYSPPWNKEKPFFRKRKILTAAKDLNVRLHM